MAGPPRITIFSDFTDPASYVTESHLRALATELGLTVEHRAVETHPAPAPLPSGREMAERIAVAAATADAIPLREPPFIPRTRKAHEAAMFAAEHGRAGEMREAIYRAYWSEGRDIGRIDVLVEIGERLGFDPADVKIALDIDRFEEAVSRDADLARRLGIRVVPVVYVGSGADAVILPGPRSRPALDAAIRSR